MKYKLVIILLLSACILLLSGVTYSVFTSDASLEIEEQDIAKFIFETEQTDQIHLPIQELKPGESTSFNFSVTNTKDGSLSNVTVEYQITLKTFHFMPLVLELYKKNGEEEENIMTCDESYSRDSNNELVCNSPVLEMSHEQESLDEYILKVSFPAEYNTNEYADLIDVLDLEIASWQKLEE